ncbi:MAG: peptidylprolyl isomerase [Candidatus Cloacimonetes bacterium]|nr:peptidylprolyl isomerase [Candidatus Cloacimonadota bacterium]MBS3767152.1 peptidylprolyl isomerase [Candidatus Cloacimonadota bacterium]
MKKLIITLICLTLLSSFLFAQDSTKIAAVVGDEVILESDVEQFQTEYSQTVQQTIPRDQAIDMLIQEELILEKANKEGIEVTNSDVDRRLNEAIKNVTSQFPSYDQFLQALKSQGLTLEQLKSQYREQISKQIKKQTILNQEVFSDISVTNFDLKNYYETHADSLPTRPMTMKIGVIKVGAKVGKENLDKALEKIKMIQNELDKGKNFSKLAREYSDCPSGKNGGNLGYFSRGSMVKPFEDVAFDLEVGKVSEPVKTRFGYHLIKVEEKKPGEIKASHILIKTGVGEKDKSVAKSEIQEVKTKLEQGGDFENIAEQYSDSLTTTGLQRITEVPVNQIEQFPLFSDTLKNLQEGEISSILNDDSDYYIFKNLGYEKERPYTFDEVSQQLKNVVRQEKQQEALENWIEELKKEIYVKKF